MAAELLSFPRLPELPLHAPYRSAYMTGQLINQERQCSAEANDRGWAMRRGMASMGRGDVRPECMLVHACCGRQTGLGFSSRPRQKMN